MKPDYETNHWMETYTGKKFYLLNPKEEDICIEDIAHSLAMQCRFGGHCDVFYSVAEHSMRVADLLPSELKLAGLLHDSAEAYMGDVVRGLKETLTGYRTREKKILKLIYKRFDVPIELVGNKNIKHIDNIMVATEGKWMMHNVDDWIGQLGVWTLPPIGEPHNWEVAERLFLISYNILKEAK